jgi:uncharacterized membrane protein YqjE
MTPGPNDPGNRSVGELVFDVSERTSTLIREEIELAKAEITEKLAKLVKGGVAGAVAGVFALCGLSMLLFAIGWLLDDLFFEDHIWIGFAIEALFWFIVAAIAGLLAYRSVSAGAPPVPEMAIEEGRRIKQTLEGTPR